MFALRFFVFLVGTRMAPCPEQTLLKCLLIDKWAQKQLEIDKASSYSHHCPFRGFSTSCPSLMTVKRGRAWEMEVNKQASSIFFPYVCRIWYLGTEGASADELSASFSGGARNLERHLSPPPLNLEPYET